MDVPGESLRWAGRIGKNQVICCHGRDPTSFCDRRSKTKGPFDEPFLPRPSRRAFLGTLTAGAVFFTTRGAVRRATRPHAVSATEGPFYPDKLPLDTDNDLIIVNDTITPAVGEITHLTGRVLDPTGSPIKDAMVEIWQCDAKAGLPAHGRQRPQEGPAGQELPGLRPVHDRFDRANTASARSSRCPTRAGRRRTSTSRSRRATGSCSPRSSTSPATRATSATASSSGAQRSFERELVHGRLQADQGLEDRRAGRELRHRPRPHSGRAGFPAIDGLVAVVGDGRAVNSPYHFF